MKTKPILRTAALALLAFLTAVGITADDKTKKAEMRVLADGDHTISVYDYTTGSNLFRHHVVDEIAGPHTFLGVETIKVGATLGAQLGLDRGIGLVVARVVPDTGAAEVLEKHDILVKLEDQLLVSPDQLGVLVRSKEPGAVVEFTIIRGGKEQVVFAEVRERKSKTVTLMGSGWSGDVDADKVRVRLEKLGKDMSREEVEQLMGALRMEGKGDVMVWSSDEASPVVRMLDINRGNIVFTDDEGTVKLMTGDGDKRLVVIDADDQTLFDGPVETEEQRGDLADAIKERLEKVENIETIEMKMSIDDGFEVDEDIHVIVPHASHDASAKRIKIIE